MAYLRKIGKNWFYTFTDSDGVRRQHKGCSSKELTLTMAAMAEADAARIRSGFVDPREACAKTAADLPIVEHLDDFATSLLSKPSSPKHVAVTRTRIEKILRLAGIDYLRDLTMSKIQAALGKLRADGLSLETVNHHVRAIKAFSRWMHRDGRTHEHLLAYLKTTNSEPDRRRVRRALTEDEAAVLLAAVENGPIRGRMTGPERAMLYRVALATGFRCAELRRLTAASFHLDGESPSVVVDACYTKNHKQAVQPLPRSLVEPLRAFLSGRDRDKPLFDTGSRPNDTFTRDLEAAGIAVRDRSDRVLDIHALRATYVTMLVRSGANVSTCQSLARHSTPTLTIGIYSKMELFDARGAVENLPDFTQRAKIAPPLRPTGTADSDAD